MFKKFAFAASLAAASALSTPAHAEWKVAETEHFIYYSEAPEAELRETVENLEKFDTLVRALTNNSRPANPVKVTMFEVATMDDVNATFPYPSRGVGGYYSSTLDGPFLVTFRDNLRTGRKSALRANTQSYAWGPEVRQHEYLHHYMYQYFNTNYPSWYSEGFAEYYGTMAFLEDNVVEIGHAPFFRLNAIRGGSWIDAEDLLSAKSYADVDDVSALYAQGWLLTHFAANNPERGKQLQEYLNAVASGTDYGEAAKAAFGDLDKLNKELKDHRNNINAVRLSLKPMDFSDIEVRDLTPVDDSLMRYRIALYSGLEYSEIPLILNAVKERRAADPNDVAGLEIQAQLENMAGMHDDALATTARLLELDPGNIEGLTERGKALVGNLETGAAQAEWDAAREPLREAIAASNVAIEPRVALFTSFEKQGQMPSVTAQNRLVEAFQLLPQNDEIRYLLARDFEQRGFIEDAISIIEPAAFGTFDGDDAEKRRRERALRRYSERYSNINNYESPKDMLDRLVAKRDGNWDEENNTFINPPQPEDEEA